MNAALRPMMVPHFTILADRGLKRAHILVYGAVVAYDAVDRVPTFEEIAEAANVNAAHRCRDVRKALASLVSAGLLRRVRYERTFIRYVPLGPTLRQQPANDNGRMYAEPVRLCMGCSGFGVCKTCGADADAWKYKAFSLNTDEA